MPAQKYRGTFKSRILTATFGVVDRVVPRRRLPVRPGAFNLLAFRDLLREKNLYDTSTPALRGVDNAFAPWKRVPQDS